MSQEHVRILQQSKKEKVMDTIKFEGTHPSDNYIAMMKLAWAQAYAEDVRRRKLQYHRWRLNLKDYRFLRTCKESMGTHLCEVNRHLFFRGHY